MLIAFIVAVLAQSSDAKPVPIAPGTLEFEQKFELAFQAGDPDQIAHLVKIDPTHIVPAFSHYAEFAIVQMRAPDPEHGMLARARSLAEAADEVFDVHGLLDTLASLEAFGLDEQRRWEFGARVQIEGDVA